MGREKNSAFEKEGKKSRMKKEEKRKKGKGKRKGGKKGRKKREKRGKKEKKESARVVISLDYSSKVEYYLLCSSSRVCIFTTILKIKIFMSGFKSNGDTTLLDGIE